MTPSKVFKKIHRKISRATKGYFLIYFPRCINNNEVYSKGISIESKGNFFFNKRSYESIKNLYETDSVDSFGISKKELILMAEDVYKHNFDLLGSGPVHLGSKIDWHLDFKVGRRWPLSYWTRIPICYNDGSDIKVPWELNRFHHLVILGKAYWLTAEERYAQEFVDQITDWIEKNPYSFGVNWVCPMEVAIRAVNWIWGWHFFKDSQTLSDEFKMVFLKSLYQHGRFIYQNLEDMEKIGGVNSNHLISNGTGLVYLGLFFSESKETKKWLNKGLEILFAELKNQIYPDGVDYEQSVNYHRLVLELLISPLIFCQKNGIEVPQAAWDKIEKMFEFVMYYTKPDGSAPQIGDADAGRLHKLSSDKNTLNDHRYLLSIGAVLFKRGDFKKYSGGFHEEAFWLLGKDGKEEYDRIQADSASLGSMAFKDSGFYIMRDNNNYMLIRAGDGGMDGFGSHSHCDTLSFEVYAGDKTFIIDPGTYCYTGDYKMRNLFRSSKYHNTVVVDDEEIKRFKEKELFRMQNDARPKENVWEVTEDYDFFDGEHYGYQRLKNPVINRRQIYFDKKEHYWVVKDILTGKGEHKFNLYFHFAPMEIGSLSVSKRLLEKVKFIRNPLLKENFNIDNTLVVETKNPEGINLLLIPVDPSGISLETEDGWTSYSYGVKVKTPIARYTKNAFCPVVFVTILYPI